MEELRKAEDLYPVVEVNRAIGLMRPPYYNLQNMLEAQSIAQEVAEKFPNYAEAWAALGIAKSALHDGEGAQECWERAIELRPNYAEVYGNIGTEHAFEGRWEDAIEYYRKALDIRSDLPVPLINLCVAYARTGRTEEAEQVYLRAREVARNHPQLWRCPFNLGRRVEAAKLRLESTRLRIEMIETMPAELQDEIPDEQFLDELW